MNKIILSFAGITILVIGILIGVVLKPASEQPIGGLVHNVQEIFTAGIKAGTSGTEFILDKSGNMTVAGESQLASVIAGGSVTTVYGTTTMTAANACDSSVYNVGNIDGQAGIAKLTLPSATTLNADCLGSNGKAHELVLFNASTSTMPLTLTAGAGIDLQVIVTSTDVAGTFKLNALRYVILKFHRISTVTTTVFGIVSQNGD